MNNLIEIKELSKGYKDSTGYTKVLFENLSFCIDQKKVTTILAPAGSGKSSLLKIIAGLELQSTGDVIDNQVSKIYIPSADSTFPWLNVRDNISYSLKNVSEAEIDDAVAFVGLEGYEDHFPHPASKGFHLRIAIARSIIRKPDLIILDEPFESVKPLVRQSLIDLVIKINREFGIAILIASTNIGRSVFISDKLFLMRKNPGEIVNEFNISYTGQRNINLYSSDEYLEMKNSLEEKIRDFAGLNEYEFTI